MSKREKIIVAMMVLSLVYGFYIFFIEPAPRKGHALTDSKLDAFNKFISNIAVLTKDGLSEIDAYIIENIGSKWTKDPLFRTKKGGQFNDKGELIPDSPGKMGITYSGYLQMGNQSLAIINGSEYETGEQLEQGGLTVGPIFPERVIIFVQGSKKKFAIPLEEMQ